jgi:hypothetical protein
MEPGLSSTLTRSDCLANSHREYTSHRNLSSGNFRENIRIRSRLSLLTGLAVRAKEIAKLGTRGLRPGFPAGTIGIGPRIEVTTEIRALLICNLLSILLTTFASQMRIKGYAHAAYMKIGTTLRTLSQAAERERLID